jgi:hypothetical protein
MYACMHTCVDEPDNVCMRACVCIYVLCVGEHGNVCKHVICMHVCVIIILYVFGRERKSVCVFHFEGLHVCVYIATCVCVYVHTWMLVPGALPMCL